MSIRKIATVAATILFAGVALAQSWPDGHGSISNSDIASFMGKNTRCGYFDSDGSGRASSLSVSLYFTDEMAFNGDPIDLMIYRWKWGSNVQTSYIDIDGYRRGQFYGTRLGQDKRHGDDVFDQRDYFRNAKISDDGILSISAGIVWDSGARGKATLLCGPLQNGRPLWAYGTERFGIDQR